MLNRCCSLLQFMMNRFYRRLQFPACFRWGRDQGGGGSVGGDSDDDHDDDDNDDGDVDCVMIKYVMNYVARITFHISHVALRT